MAMFVWCYYVFRWFSWFNPRYYKVVARIIYWYAYKTWPHLFWTNTLRAYENSYVQKSDFHFWNKIVQWYLGNQRHFWSSYNHCFVLGFWYPWFVGGRQLILITFIEVHDRSDLGRSVLHLKEDYNWMSSGCLRCFRAVSLLLKSHNCQMCSGFLVKRYGPRLGCYTYQNVLGTFCKN